MIPFDFLRVQIRMYKIFERKRCYFRSQLRGGTKLCRRLVAHGVFSRSMPALNFFGRAWLVAADDLPVPMMCLMVVHTVWYVRNSCALVASLGFLTPNAIAARSVAQVYRDSFRVRT